MIAAHSLVPGPAGLGARATRLSSMRTLRTGRAHGLLSLRRAAATDVPEQEVAVAVAEQQQQQQQQPPVAVMPREPAISERVRQRAAARRREQMTYQASAIAATMGVGALMVSAVYYRFWMHTQDGSPFPWLDMGFTLALVLGGVFGMEMWARWAHKALWHDFEPGWALHKSHHEPRIGPFEANDVYALVNAVPAMGLCLYGFLTPTLAGSVCFGAGLGITIFGMMYMFIHDGLVHKRFPVGPIADLPSMKRVVAAHRLHHTEKYGGVPWGMFFGPQELDAIGAGEELDRLVAEMDAARRTPGASPR